MVPVPGQHPIAPCHAILQTSEKAGRARARRAVIALSLIKPFKRLLFGFVVLPYDHVTRPSTAASRLAAAPARRPPPRANGNAPGGTRENRHTKQQRALAPRVLTEHTKRLLHQQTHNPMSRVRELSDRLA
jgi:hypothetical protein